MKEALVVYKKSKFELYGSSPDQWLREYVNGNHENAEEIRRSHDAQQETLDTVFSELERAGISYDVIYRADLKDVSGRRIVISVGGDGTFLESSHYILGEIPILGVNSDHQEGRSRGFFCYSNRDNLGEHIRKLDDLPRTRVNRLEIILDGNEIPERALNDVLVSDRNPAATTVYQLRVDNKQEPKYKDSGLLVCAPAGSTAWVYEEGGDVMPLDSEEIQFIRRGKRGAIPGLARKLELVSFTREGQIYIDGPHLRYDFSIGSQLLIRSGSPLTIIGDLNERRKELGISL